jgi:tetratricopeptide (TPR) repeat protein
MTTKKAFFFLSVCAALSLVSERTLTAQSPRPDALDLYKKGDIARAIEVCELELAENPGNLDAYAVLCWSLNRTRRYLEAEQRAGEARKINRYDKRFADSLAESKYHQEKNSESLALFEEYILLTPDPAVARSDTALAYYRIGELYIRLTRYQHADIALTMAVNLQQTNAYWWTRLGYARERARSYVDAIKAYDKALALDAAMMDALKGKERSLARLAQ